MTTITIRPEDLQDPYGSHPTLCRIEPAPGCDGVVCGTAVFDDQGEPASTIEHDLHLVFSGYNPLASPRYFAVSK